MYFSRIIYPDIANGLGCRCTIFVSGCTRHCKGCFNPETWGFNYGFEFDFNIIKEIINKLAPEYIQGLTILGGEPLEPLNQYSVFDLLNAVKSTYNDKKDIWMFTGCRWEDLLDENNDYHLDTTLKILEKVDILVDGPFVKSLKDISLKFRGSSNQRIIKCKDSLNSGKLILSELN